MIVKKNNKHGVYSHSEGYKFYEPNLTLEQEAKKNPLAVYNRLMRQGRKQEAKEIKEKYLNK